MTARLFALALLLAGAAPALALPQFAVRSAKACDTCHVEPVDWANPSIDLRKCSLNCNTCHVSPTGGGMRNEAGLYYGRQVLPTWGTRPADEAYRTPRLTQADGAAEEGALTQATATEQGVAPPGSAERYGGIEPHPTLQAGTDLRLMSYFPLGEGKESAVFPMQADLYLAARPYNPSGLNEGRLTLLVNTGFRGSREEEFGGTWDRFFVREAWAMYHDLPYQAYVRAGRFLPPHGWRLDDHTAFIRQETGFMGLPLDHERQVTGVEIGLNPNYAYFHLAAFNAADAWDDPVAPDDGYGVALSAGWRDLVWHLGTSLMYGSRDRDDQRFDQILGGLQWALNLQVLGWLPLIYLGEYDVNHVSHDDREAVTSLVAYHELDWILHESLVARLRYDWRDGDVDFAYDSAHQAALGLEWHPYTYVDLNLQYRHRWTNPEDRFETEADEILFILHGWY
jgi:hypothetical protein